MIDPSTRAEMKLLYDSEVAYVDDAIGRLLDHLRDLSLYDDSLIIVAGDHGEEFWEHGLTGHGQSAYQELLHVPLMIKLPGSGVRRRIESFVPVQALLPTVLELCGIDTEAHPGWTEPLTSLLAPDSSDVYNAPIVSGALFYSEAQRAAIFEGIKYIQRLDSAREELYDLRADPSERLSLVGERPDLAGRGREILNQQEEVAARIRETHGLNQATADAEHLERLRSLGYIR
jgi:arylsulfatase A-like enzyme